MPGWTVYILECADGTLYTGIARDLQKRLRQHNGEIVGGPKYTSGRRPVVLLWSDGAEDRSLVAGSCDYGVSIDAALARDGA